MLVTWPEAHARGGERRALSIRIAEVIYVVSCQPGKKASALPSNHNFSNSDAAPIHPPPFQRPLKVWMHFPSAWRLKCFCFLRVHALNTSPPASCRCHRRAQEKEQAHKPRPVVKRHGKQRHRLYIRRAPNPRLVHRRPSAHPHLLLAACKLQGKCPPLCPVGFTHEARCSRQALVPEARG